MLILQNVVVQQSSVLSEVLQTTKEMTPKIASALAIFIIGMIVIKLIAIMVQRMLVRLNIDRFLDKFPDKENLPKSLKLSSLSAKCVYWILIVLLIVTILEVLDLNSVSNKLHEIVTFIPNIIAAIIMLVVGTIIATVVKNAINTMLSSMGMEDLDIFSAIIFYFIIFMVLIMALDQIQIDISFIKTNFSLIILAVLLSFSIATILATIRIFPNILAFVRNRNALTVGDNVEINNVRGSMKKIDRFNIIIDTGESEVYLPNKDFIN